MARVTPAPGIKGRFILKTPWVASTSKIYTVVGIRAYTELIADGVNIFAKYYQPMSLTEANYNEDLQAGAYLVILYSEGGEMIHVPDTYIFSYPSQDVPPYAVYVLSILMGSFRTDYDFSFVKTKIAELISDTTGVESTVNVDAIGEDQSITSINAEQLEAGREAKISNRTTTYALLVKEREITAELREQIRSLQSLLP